MLADIPLIRWLLFDSNVPASYISEKSGVPPMTIGDLRRKQTDIMKMRLDTAVKLTQCATTEKERQDMEQTRYVIQMNGATSILNQHDLERLKNPQRIRSPHAFDPPLADVLVRPFEVVKEVRVTPEILQFEAVKERISQLATSSKQEVWYDDYHALKAAALESVGL